MNELLNTLYVMTEGTYLRLDHETVIAEADGKKTAQIPLHHLSGIVLFGNIMASPALIARSAADGRAFVLLDRHGRFRARVEGPVSGNILLRRDQHLAFGDAARPLAIAKRCVAGKIENSRRVLMRSARDATGDDDPGPLHAAAEHLAKAVTNLDGATTLDELRGYEGDAARAYFAVFDHLVKGDRDAFAFNGRSRRPPLDRMNALMSFLYVLLLSDCIAAAESVGLDPQLGFLHGLRPGRPALGLDLMEELRPAVADRLALTLVNRQQISKDDFDERPGGAVLLNDTGRKTVVVAYQKRKQEEVTHPVLDQKMPLGLVPHIQSRLLARHLRGDLAEYPPFIYG